MNIRLLLEISLWQMLSLMVIGLSLIVFYCTMTINDNLMTLSINVGQHTGYSFSIYME